jgi:hypothetical protein
MMLYDYSVVNSRVDLCYSLALNTHIHGAPVPDTRAGIRATDETTGAYGVRKG